MVVDHRYPIRFVSLYSGAGGMDLGFLQAGFHALWANDIDRTAVRTYRQNVGGHAVAGDLREQVLPERGSADLVIGGPPCQGFSVAGRMDPHDPRSRHVWNYLTVVEQIQPRAFVMENVKNLAVNDRWSSVRADLIHRAEDLGYETTLLLLNAAQFGVPQSRERMFLIGLGPGEQPFAPPVPTQGGKLPTLRAVLSQLPQFGSPGNNSVCPARVTAAKKPVLRRSPFAGMLFNGQGRPADLDAPALTLPASMGGNRTPIIDQHQLEHGGPSWVVGYHEHLRSGGAPIDRVPDRLRRITVEEAAAIQTFPDTMRFEGPVTAQFRQIGNAVPPRLAYQVALAVKRVLEYQAGPEVNDYQLSLPGIPAIQRMQVVAR
jgi:DNA (cytosine-5)-methyltransferase 1